MMISPASYIKNLENATYKELIDERESIIAFIDDYDEKELTRNRSREGWMIDQAPDVLP